MAKRLFEWERPPLFEWEGRPPRFEWERPEVWIDTIKKYFNITLEVLDAEKKMNHFYYAANYTIPDSSLKVNYLAPVFSNIAQNAYGAFKTDPGSPYRFYSIREDINYLKSIKPQLVNAITQRQKIIDTIPDEKIKSDIRQRIQYETILVNGIDSIDVNMIPIFEKDSKLARLNFINKTPDKELKAIHDFQTFADADVDAGRPMDKNILNLAGSEHDSLVKAYTLRYEDRTARKRRGGKSRKNSKKARKTRRFKRVNGRQQSK